MIKGYRIDAQVQNGMPWFYCRTAAADQGADTFSGVAGAHCRPARSVVCSTCADVNAKSRGSAREPLALRRHQLPDCSVAGASYVISVAADNLIAGQVEPFQGFDLVLSHPSTFGATKTDAINCTCQSEFGSSDKN
jgi:hypothetical protein